MSTKANTFAKVGILSAVAASLCCITPVLALFAGTTSIASSFSWMELFRPYLIGITILVLAFAWYQKLKPRTKEEIECACEEDEKPPFMQTKKFFRNCNCVCFFDDGFSILWTNFLSKNKQKSCCSFF